MTLHFSLHLVGLVRRVIVDAAVGAFRVVEHDSGLHGQVFDGASYILLVDLQQHAYVVRHQAVGIVGAVAATGVALIVIAHSHTVEGVDELVVIFLVLKDIDFVFLLLARHSRSELHSALASCVGSGG